MLNPIDVAKQNAARSEGNFVKSNYFSIADGETKYLRFLTGACQTKVISHSCGATLIDIPTEEWDAAIAAGQRPVCPQCGQPLNDSDVQYERPLIAGAFMHRFVQTSDANKKANFVCLSSLDNARFDNVPHDEASNPLYECPICSSKSNLNDKGNPKKPSYRLYAVAIEREIQQVTEMINGIPTPVIKGAADVMVTEEDGTQHPKVVLVDMGWKSFFEPIFARFNDVPQSVCYYDWRITRAGSSLDTTYTVDPLNIEAPSVVDMREYQEWIPDVHAIIKGMGSPDYYVARGWAVPGYVQQNAEQSAPQQAANVMQQAAQQVSAPQPAPIPQQPMQTQPGAVSWDAVQGQLQ